jgi:chromosome segregation ATPase
VSGLDQLLRLQRWTLDEKRRQASDLEVLIDKLVKDILNLEQEVLREVEAARNNIDLQRVLPNYREAMKERRRRLEKSMNDLRAELAKLHDEITEAFSDLKKTEQTMKNREQRQKAVERRREQIVSDEIGLQLHRRKG